MRINWDYIKMICLLALVVTLYAFSTAKNKTRGTSENSIVFQAEDVRFITVDKVNKLLIQNFDDDQIMPKDILALKEMESTLVSDSMIKSAQVYVTVNGQVRVDIEQRKPIARVRSNPDYYIDEQGFWMPLSIEHSARVPLVLGKVNKNDLEEVFRMAQKIHNDKFLKHHVTEIHQKNTGISLRIRNYDFEVLIGDLNHLDPKIFKLKAFYQKAKKDDMLETFKRVNLKYNQQVVCTNK